MLAIGCESIMSELQGVGHTESVSTSRGASICSPVITVLDGTPSSEAPTYRPPSRIGEHGGLSWIRRSEYCTEAVSPVCAASPPQYARRSVDAGVRLGTRSLHSGLEGGESTYGWGELVERESVGSTLPPSYRAA